MAEIQVRGLKELQAAFKDVDADLPKELRLEFKGIASEVADIIRGNVPQRTGKAARSVVPRATQKGFGVAAGGNRAEYYPWLDFGGRVGRNRSIERKFINSGRYIYPTIGQEKGQIAEAADDAVKKAAHRAGFDVDGSL